MLQVRLLKTLRYTPLLKCCLCLFIVGVAPPVPVCVLLPTASRADGNKTGSSVEHYVKFANRKMPQAGKYTFVLELATVEKELNDVLDVTFTVRVSEINTKKK